MTVLKDFRVFGAMVHFNENDRRAVETRRFLCQLVTLVGRAEREALELLKQGLKIERDKDGQIVKVELVIPCANVKDEQAALTLLQSKQPQEDAGATLPEKRTPRQRAAPQYPNVYRLVEVIRQPAGPSCLRFVLLETYRFIPDRGRRAGQETRATTTIKSVYFQMLVVRWLRPPLLCRLPAALKQGAAQEVVQEIESHLGLQEKGSQSSIGLPSLDNCDPKLVRARQRTAFGELVCRVEPLAVKPLRKVLRGRFALADPAGDELVVVDPLWKDCRSVPLKRQPLRFISSGGVVVYLRRWMEHGRPRAGLYAALPLASGDVPSHFFWWRSRAAEFAPLPAWGHCPLPARKKVLLVPLSVQGGRRRLKRWAGNLESSEHGRFVRALNGEERQVCWSLLVERRGEFYLQLVTKREILPVPRPNLLGVHIVLAENKFGWSTQLFWSLVCLGDGEPSVRNVIVVDRLPKCLPADRSRLWPARQERRRLAYQAARTVVGLAAAFNADLAVEEVSGVRKRGRDSEANVLATRFNFGDLTRFIADKALDRKPPVRVWRVSGYHLREAKDQPHEIQTDLVARAGLTIRREAESRS